MCLPEVAAPGAEPLSVHLYIDCAGMRCAWLPGEKADKTQTDCCHVCRATDMCFIFYSTARATLLVSTTHQIKFGGC